MNAIAVVIIIGAIAIAWTAWRIQTPARGRPDQNGASEGVFAPPMGDSHHGDHHGHQSNGDGGSDGGGDDGGG